MTHCDAATSTGLRDLEAQGVPILVEHVKPRLELVPRGSVGEYGAPFATHSRNSRESLWKIHTMTTIDHRIQIADSISFEGDGANVTMSVSFWRQRERTISYGVLHQLIQTQKSDSGQEPFPFWAKNVHTLCTSEPGNTYFHCIEPQEQPGPICCNVSPKKTVPSQNWTCWNMLTYVTIIVEMVHVSRS